MKILKKIMVLVIISALCLSLSSCLVLEEIRKGRAEYNNDLHTEIVFRNKIYKQLEGTVNYPLDTYLMQDYGNVVEKEVPLLLTNSINYGTSMCYSENDTRMLNVLWDNEAKLYIREDIYNYAKQTLQYLNFENYCIQVYDEHKGEYVVDRIGDSFISTVYSILYDVSTQVTECVYEDSVTVYATDAEGLFMWPEFSVDRLEDGEYLIYLENQEDTFSFKVPQNMKGEFDKFYSLVDSHELGEMY